MIFFLNQFLPQNMTSVRNIFPDFRSTTLFMIFILVFPTSFISFTLFSSLATALYSCSKGELIVSSSRYQLFNNFMVTRDLALVGTWLFFLRYALQILTSILRYICSCLEVFGRRLSVGKFVCCFVPFFLETILFLVGRLRTFVTILFLSFPRCLIFSTQILALSPSGQKPTGMLQRNSAILLSLQVFSVHPISAFPLPKNPLRLPQHFVNLLVPGMISASTILLQS